MIEFKKLTKSEYNKFAHLLIIFLPISYVVGSFLLNSLLIIFGIIFFYYLYKGNIILDKKKYFFLVFFLIFIATNALTSDHISYVFYKFLSYSRFYFFSILLIFLLFFCSQKQLKFIVYFFSFFLSLVIIDTLIQFFFGKDLFGFEVNYNKAYGRLSGPFGDEFIVGSFLFTFGFISYYLKKYFFLKNYYIDFLYLIFLPIVIFITGERSAFLSTLILLFLLIIFQKNERKKIFSYLIIVLISCYIIVQNFQPLKDRYSFSILTTTYLSVTDVENKNIDNETLVDKQNKSLINELNDKKNSILNTLWFKHFNGAIEIFKNNLFFGSGFKTYRYACLKIENKNSSDVVCTTHPHNIYFELLSDLGLLGFFIFSIFLIKIIYDFFKLKLYNNFRSNIIFSLVLSFLFPFKPHGSLFTTNYAFLFWIIISFLIYEFYFKNQSEENE